MITYNYINHTADLGVYFTAESIKKGFENTGWILFDQITDIANVEPAEKIEIKITAKDEKELLINWINELIYIYEIKSYLLKEFMINKFSSTKLEAVVSGEKINLEKHKILKEIKAATYHQLEIEMIEKNKYYFKIIFDI